jgi:hypothetical protein
MTRYALRPLAVVLALVPLGFSGVVFLGSLLWGLGLRCDDSCGGGDWRRTEDAWQWNVLPVLGSLTLICGLALVVCVWRGWVTGAFASLVAGTLTVLAAGTWLEPGWHEHVDRSPKGVLLCLLVFTAGLCAVVSSRTSRARTG